MSLSFKPILLASVYIRTDPAQLTDFLHSFTRSSKLLVTDLFICLDGQISDDVSRVVSRYCDQSPCVYHIASNDSNLGLAKSLNKMIVRSLQLGYNLFFRADTDDLLHPQRLLLQYNFLASNPSIDICGTWYSTFPDKVNILLPTCHSDIIKTFSYGLALAHPTVAFTSTFIEKSGLYSSSLRSKTEDIQLWFNGFVNGARFANLPIPLYYMRVDQATFKRRTSFTLIVDVLILRFKHIVRHKFSLLIFFRALIEATGRIALLILPNWLKRRLVLFYQTRWNILPSANS